MMSELWLGIIVLTLVALAFVCWPIWAKLNTTQPIADVNRQQENVNIFQQRMAELEQEYQQNLLTLESFQALKVELEKNLLSDADAQVIKLSKENPISKQQLLLVMLLCVALILVSSGFYSKYGSYDDLFWAQNNKITQHSSAADKPTPEEAIVLLQAELAREPNNPEGWYMLAGIYMESSQYAKGAQAFTKVLDVLPADSPQYASVIGQYAQALFFNEGKVTAAVKAQITRALSIDAQEVVSLGLLGIEAFEKAEYQQAINFWRSSLKNASPNAAQALESGIAKAEQKLRDQGLTVETVEKDEEVETVEKKDKQANLAQVVVDVEIEASLLAGLDKNTTLFVFAKPVGGRAPLAAVKMKVSELPKRIVLDDSLAMMPSAKISFHEKVEVSARVSLNGQPRSQKGDIESAVLVLDVSKTANSVKLLINKVVE